MPFTAAHPAIILPLLRRRWFSATALVIGSMAPDFEYFFRLRTQSEVSHTLAGLLLFNLPVTLLLCLLFHSTVRDLAVQFLPPYFKKRALAQTYPADWLQYLRANWLVVSSSALLGAFSHLFWDSFTHQSLYFVSVLPVLSTVVEIPFIDFKIELHRLLQHLSTAVGFVAILGYVHLLPSTPLLKTERKPWFIFWFGVVAAGFLFLLLNMLVRPHLVHEPGDLIATLISGWMMALLFSGLAAKARVATEKQKG
ncbi:DUF4184 family protein [Pontibacter anaerobius]|uniref:DUF4184 family protein n=1 Tax=Pontibacter anaerobius TaxID=2993940 RepID=A0ABT3RA48_9BACT|nr:DUF4184 family protein [Pontibacter anaerobius]MCX2738728.1 DUF4184 family protein [Pontibacter anaerobius]